MIKLILTVIIFFYATVAIAQQASYNGVIAKQTDVGLVYERPVKFTVFTGVNAPVPTHSFKDDCTDIQINIPETLQYALQNNEVAYFENDVIVLNDDVKQKVILKASAHLINTSLVVKCNYNNAQYTCVLKDYKH
jgi:hypothetical protein